MASKRTLGFSSTVFRKKFRAGMIVRNYRDNEVVFVATLRRKNSDQNKYSLFVVQLVVLLQVEPTLEIAP